MPGWPREVSARGPQCDSAGLSAAQFKSGLAYAASYDFDPTAEHRKAVVIVVRDFSRPEKVRVLIGYPGKGTGLGSGGFAGAHTGEAGDTDEFMQAKNQVDVWFEAYHGDKNIAPLKDDVIKARLRKDLQETFPGAELPADFDLSNCLRDGGKIVVPPAMKRGASTFTPGACRITIGGKSYVPIAVLPDNWLGKAEQEPRTETPPPVQDRREVTLANGTTFRVIPPSRNWQEGGEASGWQIEVSQKMPDGSLKHLYTHDIITPKSVNTHHLDPNTDYTYREVDVQNVRLALAEDHVTHLTRGVSFFVDLTDRNNPGPVIDTTVGCFETNGAQFVVGGKDERGRGLPSLYEPLKFQVATYAQENRGHPAAEAGFRGGAVESVNGTAPAAPAAQPYQPPPPQPPIAVPPPAEVKFPHAYEVPYGSKSHERFLVPDDKVAGEVTEATADRPGVGQVAYQEGYDTVLRYDLKYANGRGKLELRFERGEVENGRPVPVLKEARLSVTPQDGQERITVYSPADVERITAASADVQAAPLPVIKPKTEAELKTELDSLAAYKPAGATRAWLLRFGPAQDEQLPIYDEPGGLGTVRGVRYIGEKFIEDYEPGKQRVAAYAVDYVSPGGKLTRREYHFALGTIPETDASPSRRGLAVGASGWRAKLENGRYEQEGSVISHDAMMKLYAEAPKPPEPEKPAQAGAGGGTGQAGSGTAHTGFAALDAEYGRLIANLSQAISARLDIGHYVLKGEDRTDNMNRCIGGLRGFLVPDDNGDAYCWADNSYMHEQNEQDVWQPHSLSAHHPTVVKAVDDLMTLVRRDDWRTVCKPVAVKPTKDAKDDSYVFFGQAEAGGPRGIFWIDSSHLPPEVSQAYKMAARAGTGGRMLIAEPKSGGGYTGGWVSINCMEALLLENGGIQIRNPLDGKVKTYPASAPEVAAIDRSLLRKGEWVVVSKEPKVPQARVLIDGTVEFWYGSKDTVRIFQPSRAIFSTIQAQGAIHGAWGLWGFRRSMLLPRSMKDYGVPVAGRWVGDDSSGQVVAGE